MQFSNHLFIFSLIIAIIGLPSAFADVNLVGVDIFCPLEEILGFTGIVPFLEICPINTAVGDDLELKKLSPVQAVFDPLKVVDSKITLLKLDIENTFATTKTAQVTLVVDGAPPIIENVAIVPGTESYYLPSTNFIFPTGTDFTASADIEIIAGETNTANNFDSFSIPVQDTIGIGIVYTRVQLTSDPTPSPACFQMIPFADNSEEYVTGSYPINQDEYFSFTNCFIPFLAFPDDGTKLSNLGLEDLYKDLELITLFPGIDKTVGVVRDMWFDDNTNPPRTGEEGLAGVLGQTFDSVIIEVDNNLGQVTAHELAHTYFETSAHPIDTPTGYWVDKGCEMGFFDTNDNSCDDQVFAFNFMTEDVLDLKNNGQVDGVIRSWVGTPQFNELFEDLSQGPFDPPVISIRGIIFDDGTTTLDPWYQFEGDLDAPLGSTGEISLQYLDENDLVIGETGFDLMRGFSNDATVLEFGAFSTSIPDIVGTKKIVLTRGAEQLAERVISNNIPSVTVISPNGDELFVHGQSIPVTWQSSDVDGDQLSHILLISTDNGQTWIPLQIDIDSNQIDLEVPTNVVSDSLLVRIIATDGVQSAEDISDATFSIQEFQGELDCSTAVPSSDTLWPPNHKMVEISIEGITKANGSPITTTITSIFQDEPTTGTGGDKTPDGDGIGTGTALVRSERLGGEDGRVYHVFFDAIDDLGATCSGEVLVSVPHDQGGTPAIDGGAQFDSTV